jgi:hypothetical protein
MYTKKARK